MRKKKRRKKQKRKRRWRRKRRKGNRKRRKTVARRRRKAPQGGSRSRLGLRCGVKGRRWDSLDSLACEISKAQAEVLGYIRPGANSEECGLWGS